MTYNPQQIEPKWQKYWEQNQTFKASINKTQQKYYVLDMFPYPSGYGLHVGHLEGYTATDIVSRYKRMQGFNVLHCMGWDAFGLPAEQFAIQTGTHPATTTAKNIANFKRQIQRLGFSYDWKREINTTDPQYYKWTQWIFLQLYNRGLAYLDEAYVNWCPALKTVLANEEVIDGKSERGQHPVERRTMRQWKLKITAYADQLLEGLDDLDWPEPIKEMQRNWIGKSEGAKVIFTIQNTTQSFEIFTTRPDTLFGATYCVLAPEHPLVDQITTSTYKNEVQEYQDLCCNKSDLSRLEGSSEKTGVFTGAYAINPVNQKPIPIWIADYVMVSYGTGAIMAVPAHDQRDYEFAIKFKLPIIPVIAKSDITQQAYVGEGLLTNSDFLNGLNVSEAKKSMIQWLEKQQYGQASISYKMRDWIFSRQRYWGEPFPLLIKEDHHIETVNESDLPLTLPEIDQYEPSGTGESPLVNITDWINVTLPDGTKARRDSNTMPQWAGSCWYYLRFIDPQNFQQAWSKDAEKYWMPVDLYVGGAEHAVLHLLYARFWHKVLYDEGHVHTSEPFKKLVNQGMILGENGQKMSKSLGNIVNPDEVVDAYGADTIRLYEMFMGPLEKSKPWNMTGVEGIRRFLNRIWRMIINDEGLITKEITENNPSETELKVLHTTIKKVTDDLENLRFNTAISQMMVLVNELTNLPERSKKTIQTFILLLSPFAPHLSEELWQKLGGEQSLVYEPWPKHDEQYLVCHTYEIPVQINGKVRGKINVPANITEDEILMIAKNQPNIQKYLNDQTIRKIIFIQNKILNIVI